MTKIERGGTGWGRERKKKKSDQDGRAEMPECLSQCQTPRAAHSSTSTKKKYGLRDGEEAPPGAQEGKK